MSLIDLNNDDSADTDEECNLRPVITLREAKKKTPQTIMKRPRKPRKVLSPKKPLRQSGKPNFNKVPEEPKGSTSVRGKIYKCYNTIPTPYKPFLQFQYDETVMNNPILIQNKLQAAKRKTRAEEREKENHQKKSSETYTPPTFNRWYTGLSKPTNLQPTLSVKTQPVPLNHISKPKREYAVDFL